MRNIPIARQNSWALTSPCKLNICLELYRNEATAQLRLPKISEAQYLITEFNIANASLCSRDTLCPCKISWIQ